MLNLERRTRDITLELRAGEWEEVHFELPLPPAWMKNARCARPEFENINFDSDSNPAALAVCHACPVKDECLEDALVNRILYGVLGGTSPTVRRAILAEREGVAA